MWEALALRLWPGCAEVFLTDDTDLSCYRDIFTTFDGGWFEKVCADVGTSRSAFEYFLSSASSVDITSAGPEKIEVLESALAALNHAVSLDLPAETGEEHFCRAAIAMGALPMLATLLEKSESPEMEQVILNILASFARGDSTCSKTVVSAGAIPPIITSLLLSNDYLTQYSSLINLRGIAFEEGVSSLIIKAGGIGAMKNFIDKRSHFQVDLSAINPDTVPAGFIEMMGSLGLLSPDGGSSLHMWTSLLLVLSKKHRHPEASQMLEIAPCLSSLIVDPLFAIASSTTMTDSMDNLLWTVYYLCSADNKSNAEAEEVCGAFYDAGVVGRLVELACSGMSDGIVYIALANINHHFVQDDEHKEAVIDAGFLDSAHRFFDGECADKVKIQACGILCDLVESKCICSHGTALAGLCKKMTFIALEAEGALEEQAMTFSKTSSKTCAQGFSSLLSNLANLAKSSPR